MATVIGFQAAHQGIAGHGLQPRVQGRAHVIAAAIDVLAPGPQGDAARLFDEIVGILVFSTDRRIAYDQRRGHGLLQLGIIEHAQLVHLTQDPVAPGHGRTGVLAGVIVVRALGQGRQEGRLGRSQFIQRLAEIVVGRSRHAKGPVSEEDLVQIQFEDLFLRQDGFEALRQDGLAHLAADGGVAGQQDVLGNLLGDGRTAFQTAPARQVQHIVGHGPAEARNIDAAMLEEMLVLGRQEGLDHDRRDFVVGHEDPALLRELADQGPVPGIDPRRRRRAIVGQFARIGQIMEQIGRVQRDNHADERHKAEDPDPDHDEPTLGCLHVQLPGPANWQGEPVDLAGPGRRGKGP